MLTLKIMINISNLANRNSKRSFQIHPPARSQSISESARYIHITTVDPEREPDPVTKLE
jgi:hypothetical protein